MQQARSMCVLYLLLDELGWKGVGDELDGLEGSLVLIQHTVGYPSEELSACEGMHAQTR